MRCDRAGPRPGLILLTGGTRGPLARLLAEGRQAEAAALLRAFAEAFGDRTVVELHRHGLPLERAIEPGLIALADAAGLPLVATNECFFATASMHEAHDALLCIAHGRADGGPGAPPGDGRALVQACAGHARAVRGPAGGVRQHARHRPACAVMAETRKPLLPVCPKVRPGTTEDETLRAMAREGLVRDGALGDRAARRMPSGWNTSWASSPRWASRATS